MGPHGQAAEHAGPLYQVPESNAAPYELSDQMQQAALDNWVPVNRHRYRVYPGISVTGTLALVTIDSSVRDRMNLPVSSLSVVVTLYNCRVGLIYAPRDRDPTR